MTGALRLALLCLCAPLLASVYAADAKVTDVSGSEYLIKSARLTKSKTLDMDCGGVEVRHPFGSVKTVNVYPSRMKSVDGKLHFGIEFTLLDSAAASGARACFVPADNAVSGKSSKGTVTVPFEKLRSVYILGKDEKGVNEK